MVEFIDPWEEKKLSFGMGESSAEFADPWEEPEPSGLLRRGVVDPLVGLAKGVVVNVPQTALGLLDIPTMGYAGKAADVALKATLGIGVKEAGEKFDELLSPEARLAKQKVEEAEGFVPVLKTALQYPSSIVQAAAENLPTMYGGAMIGRKVLQGIGLGIGAEGITAAQRTGRAIAAGATGEAIITAGQNIEQVRQEAIGGTLSPGQVGINMVSAALTGLIGAAGGKLAQRFGFVDVDTLLAGGRGITPFDKATSIKGVLAKIVGGAISEGAFEELPQSMQEQIAQNISLGKPAGEGVLESGAMGMLVGALLGAFGAGVAEMTPTQKRLREDPLDQEIHKQIGELPEEEAAIKLAPPVEEPPITGEPPVEEPPPAPPEGPPAPPVVTEEPPEGPTPPVVPEAQPIIPEPDYAAEAAQAGVVFNGLQETGEGKRPLPLFTDPVTKSTFTLWEGETIPDALARVREKFKPEKPPSAPRFSPAGYTSEGEALASIKAKKLNLADFNVEKVDDRWMVTPKEGTPAEIAQAEEKPLRGAEGPEKVSPTPMMKDIAKAIDYKGRKFKVDQKIPQRLDSYWDGGSRDYYYFYNPQNGKIQEVHSNHPFYEADRPRDLNDLPPGLVLVRRTYFQGKDIGLTLYASPAPTAPALEAPKPAPVTVTEVKPSPAERLAEPILPERMKTLDRLTEMARSLSRKNELATIPVKGYNLSPNEQQELVKRGIAFDVDRMGEPQIRLSKETRINELREKVKAARKVSTSKNPINAIVQEIKKAGGIGLGTKVDVRKNIPAAGLKAITDSETIRQLTRQYPGLIRASGDNNIGGIAEAYGMSDDDLIEVLKDPRELGKRQKAVTAQGEGAISEKQAEHMEKLAEEEARKGYQEQQEAYEDERRQERAEFVRILAGRGESITDIVQSAVAKVEKNEALTTEERQALTEFAERWAKAESDAERAAIEEEEVGEVAAEEAAPAEKAPPKEAYIGKTETAELGGPLSAAATFELAPTETEMGELKPKDRGPKTEGMFEETKYGELGPDDAWGGYGEWLDMEVRQAWTKKLEDYENELRRIEKEDRDRQVAGNPPGVGRGEISLRRRLRDRRLFDAQIKSIASTVDREKWEGTNHSPEFGESLEFKYAEQHFARFGFYMVPITKVDWGMAVVPGKKIIFMGEMGGDRFAYFMSHETSHILSAQGNEAVNAIKAAIDLSHPLVIKQREGYDWTDDYTRDEFAASIVGGAKRNEALLKGDQTANIKAAREAAEQKELPGGETKAGIVDAIKSAFGVIDSTIIQQWKTKLEEFQNGQRRTLQENRNAGASGILRINEEREILRQRGLRDRRIVDAKVQRELAGRDRIRWEGVSYSTSLGESVGFLAAREHFASLGYNTVPITAVKWNGCVDFETKTVFIGEAQGSQLFYTLSHETSHILSSQNNEAVKTIKESINIDHPYIKGEMQRYGWDEDYTRDEFTAAIVGGMNKPQWVKGDQSANIKIARETSTQNGKSIEGVKYGSAYGFVQPRPPAFYSKLSQTIQGASFTKMPVPQLKAFLKGKQVTDAEIENITGNLTGTVTKQQVQEEIRANSTEFQDVVLGEEKQLPQGYSLEQLADESWALKRGDEVRNRVRFDTDNTRQRAIDFLLETDSELQGTAQFVNTTKFSNWQEPGSVPGSYREMFVTAPLNLETVNKGKLSIGNMKSMTDDEVLAAYKEIKNPTWQDGHSAYSDIQNPIVRIRYNEREVEGKRILFVEEIQGPSDANQDKMPEHLRKRIYDIGVKRILALAKEQGFGGVAWTTGEMQADRYDLAKKLETVKFAKAKRQEGATGDFYLITAIDKKGVVHGLGDHPTSALPDIVGKELARKITESNATEGEFSGLDLKVGGEGLKRLYDVQIPALFRKYGKEGVGEISAIPGKEDIRDVKTDKAVSNAVNDGYTLYDGKGNLVSESEARELISQGDKFVTGVKAEELKSVPMIPITEKTPESYTMYGDIVPAVDKKLLAAVRDLADKFMDKPQETIPQEDLAEFKTWFLAQKDLKTWERVFELPWTLARKHPIWRKAFQIFGLDRPEMRGKLIHKFAVVAEPYLALEKNMREAGKSKADIKDAKERLARVIITGDAALGPQLKAMRRQLRDMKAGPQRDTLIARIKQIETENRYSDEDLLKGIKDDQGNTVKLNKDEIELYKSVRNSLDLMFDTYLNHIKAQSFRTYRKQKWYAILAQAADMDLTQDQTLSILKTGLNQAALLRAVKIQPDIQRIFERVESQIASTPDAEKLAAGELYGAIADKLTKEIGDLRTAIGTLTGITEDAELTDMTRGVLNAYMFTRPYLKKIKTLRNTYKKQVAFFPRVREQGPYKLKLMKRIYNKEGLVAKEEQLFMEMFGDEAGGRKIYEKIYKLYGKNGVLPDDMYIPKPEPTNVTPEFAFQGVSDINMQSLLDDAIEGMKIRDVYYDKKGNKVNIQERLRDMGYQALAKQFQARGFGRHMIHRQWNVVKGYEENNLQSVLTNYMSGMSGMMTKQIAAADFLELMKELQPGEKGHFKGLSMYGRGQLRNTTRADRIGGGLRAWAFTWVLGGVLRPAVLQFTQNYVTGIPKHAKWLRENNLGGFGKADKDYNKAMKDLVTKNLMPLEKQMQAELFTSGHTVDQYVREMFDALGNRFDQERAKWLRWLAYPFSQMEQFNRKSAALTRFRPAYQLALKEGLTEEEAYKKAYNSAIDFIGDTHYFMGKPNLPLYAQGEGMGIALRTGLTFKSFMHNFVLQIKSDLSEGDWKTVMHQMAYIVLFGGMMGLPFFKDLFEWVEKEFGYSFTRSIRQTLRSAGGRTLETFGMNGLPAMLGANMSGSLAIGIPFLGEETMATIGGVYEGQLKKLKLGAEAALRGDKYRAVLGMTPEFFRSPLIAAQESELGKEVFGSPGYTTTVRGQPVWGKEGKPLAMGPYEALAKAGGFLPTEFGREREMGQTVKRLEIWATEKKQDAGERFRIARVQKDPKALKNLMEDVREINQGIRARGLQNLVPLASVQRIIQSSRQVKNLKQRREQAFKRAEL